MALPVKRKLPPVVRTALAVTLMALCVGCALVYVIVILDLLAFLVTGL